ncbi:MAG: Sulfatase [Promethearchaeota archaeon]|nr:MAG: Sulfatase [Candidatus Lokiarchaeota archaeon]
MMETKPNIVLFITHDQGQYLNCYNSEQTPNSLRTPNFDKVARKGIRFTNNFCTAPQCSPSRGSIQTSLYPHQNGLMGLVNLGWTLPESNATLPMYLKENGYTTHLLGLQHESLDAKSLGYDTVSKRGAEFKYSVNRMEKKYSDFFSDHKDDEKPFFVNIGAIEVHRPFQAWSEPVDPSRVQIPPYMPDNEQIRKDLAGFYGNIELVDKVIGNIIDYLEDVNLMEDTLFIYTTDHGIPFPRAKCTLYDPGIKTLLLMYNSSMESFSGGKTYDQLISNIDLVPTLIELVGGELPDNIEGKSFLPLLSGTEKVHREEIYSEKTYHEIYDPLRSIRTRKYKYIKNFEEIETAFQIPKDIAMDPSGKFIMEQESYKEPRSMEELYDLEKDPNEKENLFNDGAYQEILYELRTKLFAWMEKTDDPLLTGKVPEKRQKVKNHY